ncbi:hypothetical protein ZOSMA_78G00740 [Zostera marina]|uniref:Uncharacterized protein n=1 Tax=Zostera marina TaxID=29655 RepID=A0A0K9NNW0_ZOSMR|nr:hypothetical protein ZOSMA_78G00740 [Zostera marina]
MDSSSLSSLSEATPTMNSTNPPPPPSDRCRTEAVKRELSIRTRSFSPMFTSPTQSPSSSSSSSTRLSSPFTLPSPVRPSTLSSSVPFSWESKPGVPKTNPADGSRPKPKSSILLLPPPPPPPPRSSMPEDAAARRRLKKNTTVFDPFTVALMECSKEKDYWKMSPVRETTKQREKDYGDDNDGRSSRLRPRVLGYLFSLDLYPSCKTTTIATSVANSNVYIRRRYEVLHRRQQ